MTPFLNKCNSKFGTSTKGKLYSLSPSKDNGSLTAKKTQDYETVTESLNIPSWKRPTRIESNS